MSADGTRVFVSEPDEDALLVVTLPGAEVSARVALPEGSEPGRIAEDGAERVHVVLRRAGAVASIDLATGTLVDTRAVCAAPRGIAWDGADDTLHVACADGLLVTLPAAGGPPTRVLALEDDLRDVVVAGDRLLVSVFRSANVIAVDRAGEVVARWVPATVMEPAPREMLPDVPPPASFVPAVAWRMIPAPGGAWMLHQRASDAEIDLESSERTTGSTAYGGSGGCGGLVQTTAVFVSASAPSGTLAPTTTVITGLAVDLAYSSVRDQLLFVSPVNGPTPQSVLVRTAELAVGVSGDVGCTIGRPMRGEPAIAGAFLADGSMVYQTRGASDLVRWPVSGSEVRIPLSLADHRDEGLDLFHRATGSGLVCASCHPEGGDDGRVWRFSGMPAVRTQTVRGGLMATAPFHWLGDMESLQHLIGEVMVRRMGGVPLAPHEIEALGGWLDALPAPPRPHVDEAAAARGRALFESPEVGCATCHAGGALTTSVTVDVGTGGAFQVPTLLGIAYRAPYMHDGCAPTLRARLDDEACGGGDTHGRTSHLTSEERDDLVAYLRTL